MGPVALFLPSSSRQLTKGDGTGPARQGNSRQLWRTGQMEVEAAHPDSPGTVLPRLGQQKNLYLNQNIP